MKRFRAAIMLILSACIAVLVCGCASEIDGWEVRASQKVCEDHGGLETMHTLFNKINAECSDGAWITVERPK